METKQWKDVLHIISGKNQKAVANPNGKYPIYGSGGIIGYADDYLCEAGTTIVGRKGTINKPIFVDEPFWNIDTAFGVAPGKNLNPKYLYYFCLYFNFMPLDKSTGRPSLAKSDLLKIKMPVPSLSIQEQIVKQIEESLSQLDSAVATLKKTKQQLEIYRQAVLKEAFAECDSSVTIQSICLHVTDGDHMPPPKAEEGVPFIMISNINNNRIHWDNTAHVGIDYYNQLDNKRKPQKGDVLYTVTGSFGIPVLVDFEKEFCFQRHIALLRPNEQVNQEYLYYALQTPSVFNQARDKATGTAQKTVGLTVLRKIEIPFTESIEKQMKIVERIKQQLSMCANIEQTVNQSLQQSQALRQSILKQAFETEN